MEINVSTASLAQLLTLHKFAIKSRKILNANCLTSYGEIGTVLDAMLVKTCTSRKVSLSLRQGLLAKIVGFIFGRHYAIW